LVPVILRFTGHEPTGLGTYDGSLSKIKKDKKGAKIIKGCDFYHERSEMINDTIDLKNKY
jgi:hypothetical protein